MLIRPVLWRELKVGSRIVSHRFTMGDWKPDKTVSVMSELGGIFELHLWTINEDIKRKLVADSAPHGRGAESRSLRAALGLGAALGHDLH